MFNPAQTTHDYMSLVLTHECNKSCPFCIDRYRGSGEFVSIETVRKALVFAAANHIKDILLIGGEPTLHPEVVEIARTVKAAGFRAIMTTNYTRPEVVRQLDGIVDCFNVSFYNQPELPRQKDFASDITLHTLIHAKQLQSRGKLDAFIEAHAENGHLKFSTLSVCNDWTQRNQAVEYLDFLPCQWTILFNEIAGQIYRGAVIKRHDRLLNRAAHQSFKAHVNGEIRQSWEREKFPA